MGMQARATFKGADFSRLENIVRQKVYDAVTDGTVAVLEESRRSVPVDTGDLAKSGQHIVEYKGYYSVVGYVSYDAPWAAFVELGTGIRGMGTYPYALPQEGVPFTGAWQYDFRNQGWIGHAAQPYLRPALDFARDAIMDAFKSRFPG